MSGERYDLIGDVHGMRATLEVLLERLGHVRGPEGWHHPEGRRVVFVGDLIDRGPDPLGCLDIARELVEQANALMVLGNHELNALHYLHEPPLRERSGPQKAQFHPTLDHLQADPQRWAVLSAFLRRCPLALELDEGRLRVVHACWDEEHVARLPRDLVRDEDLVAVSEWGDLIESAETCLKGPEEPCVPFVDAHGQVRVRKRVPWWVDHPADAPFTVFGHYWFPWRQELEATPREPALLGEGRNAACLDWCAGRGGPAVALRWPERDFVLAENVDRPQKTARS